MRTKNEFVPVSAAGMTPERMDVELFGQEGEDGRTAKVGVFERAHSGTLYLDEVADMPRADARGGSCGSWSTRAPPPRWDGDLDVHVGRPRLLHLADLREEIAAGRLPARTRSTA